jgi:signal transduction protein with GAF and PtsI domain
MKHLLESSSASIKVESHMRDLNGLRENVPFALKRVLQEAAGAENAEQALWIVTRTLPSLLGNSSGDHCTGEPTSAAAGFMATPDRRHHLITAPVNFRPEQYHELVTIDLGHPGIVARTRRGVFLADTSHHESFVKILQTFRAGSAMQLPMLWKGDYLGVLICANAARGAFEELDFQIMEAFAALAAALWVAHEGPAWLCTIDYDKLPVRRTEQSS